MTDLHYLRIHRRRHCHDDRSPPSDRVEHLPFPGYAQGTPFVPNTGLRLAAQGRGGRPADIAARMRAGEAVTLNSLDSANDDGQGGSLERRIDRLIDLTERMLETENRQLAAMNKPQLPGYRNVA